MSGNNIKGTQEVLKDNECERGNVVNRPPIPYVPPVDPHEKQGTEQIKVKLPDGTHFQMSAFRAGNNEEYIEHVILVLRLLDQKGIKFDILKAFKVVKEIAKKLEPLATPLPSDAAKSVKEEQKLQMSVATEELQTARDGAIVDPASIWFEVVELPLVRRLKTTQVNGRELLVAEEIFDKSSDCIA